MDFTQEINLAKTAAQELNIKKALAILGSVISKDPKNVDAWLTIAQVIDDPERKIECYNRVLVLDPENIEAKLELNALQQEAAVVALPEFDPEPEPEPEPEPGPDPDYLPDEPLSPVKPIDDPPLPAQPDPPEPGEDDPFDTPERETPSEAIVEEDPFESTPEPIQTSSKPKVSVRKEGQKKKPAKKQRKARRRADSGFSILEWVLIGIIVIVVMCTGVYYIGTRVFQSAETPGADSLAISDVNPTDVIIENVRASNAEDITRYMATIHSESPVYDSTRDVIVEAFDTFDLSYEISRMAIIEQTNSRAEVEFTLTTRYVRGPSGFRDNTIMGVMFLRLENGDWKIYDQNVDDVEYHDN